MTNRGNLNMLVKNLKFENLYSYQYVLEIYWVDNECEGFDMEIPDVIKIFVKLEWGDEVFRIQN